MSDAAQTASLFRDIVRACRARRGTKIADSTGLELTGPDLLTRALVARRYLRRAVFAADERMVGVFLPPTGAAVVANLALLLDRRVPINLNYTLSQGVLDAKVKQAGIRHVLTSRRFVDKIGLRPGAELVYLEDLAPRVSPLDKAVGALQARVIPEGPLLRALRLDRVPADELMTVIFTSGTTGVPKGVMLSFANIEANLRQVDHVIHLVPSDVVVGILPFFHAFGSTVTLWTVLARDIAAIYHTNPLEAQVVGRLTAQRAGTILVSTPMFLRSYLRRCEPAELASLTFVGVGGERLPPELARAFAGRFGIEPVEGYGMTEMAPLVSANASPARFREDYTAWHREGTVGRPVPGVRTRVVDPETGADLATGEQGMLLLTGPNLMLGYLDDPAATAAVIRDGWYVTGDIASVDADGFIRLHDRQSRFAKIAGEMVPFAAVEEVLVGFLGFDEAGLPRAVVTAIPDEARGERLVVVHTPVAERPADLRQRLVAAGLPNLFIPGADSFVEVPAMPKVGIGKVDQKGVRQEALRAFGRLPAAAMAG